MSFSLSLYKRALILAPVQVLGAAVAGLRPPFHEARVRVVASDLAVASALAVA